MTLIHDEGQREDRHPGPAICLICYGQYWGGWAKSNGVSFRKCLVTGDRTGPDESLDFWRSESSEPCFDELNHR